MNQQEYKQLTTETIERRVLGLADLVNRTPRTLIFGYTTDRDTFHVYIGPDNLIHVLFYSERGSSVPEGEPRFLILGHTFGESGGLQDNGEYVPNKRVYPESCDYEFCKVLKSHGVNIPFTTFTEDADARRKEARNGYAGHTFEDGGCPVVSLRDPLVEDPAFPRNVDDRQALASRLVSQAARELRAHTVTSMCGEYVAVASTSADKVLEKARQFLHSLSETTVLESGLAETLVSEAFGPYRHLTVFEERVSGGEFSIELSAKDVDFCDGADLARYDGKPDGFWLKAVVGTYQGRPFIACKNKNGHADIRLSQFGETERFLEQWLRMYGLEPAKVSGKTGKARKT
jgi:hypothetical protein